MNRCNKLDSQNNVINTVTLFATKLVQKNKDSNESNEDDDDSKEDASCDEVEQTPRP